MKNRRFLCMLIAMVLVFACIQPAFAEGMLGDPIPGPTIDNTLFVCGMELEDGNCLIVADGDEPKLATCSFEDIPDPDDGYAFFTYDEDNDIYNLVLDNLCLDEGLTTELDIDSLIYAVKQVLFLI